MLTRKRSSKTSWNSRNIVRLCVFQSSLGNRFNVLCVRVWGVTVVLEAEAARQQAEKDKAVLATKVAELQRQLDAQQAEHHHARYAQSRCSCRVSVCAVACDLPSVCVYVRGSLCVCLVVWDG